MNPRDLIVSIDTAGIIGGHVIDWQPLDERSQRVDQIELGLRERAACKRARAGARQVYNLMTSMGENGFIYDRPVQHHLLHNAF